MYEMDRHSIVRHHFYGATGAAASEDHRGTKLEFRDSYARTITSKFGILMTSIILHNCKS